MTTNGTVTASSFTGDGSGITGVSDSTKLAKAGDTMTGDLDLGGNDITNAGTVAASSYTGDGSGLSGIITRSSSVEDTSPAVAITQMGEGGGLYVGRYNVPGTDPMVGGDTNTQVPFMKFTYGGNPYFTVNYNGDVTTNGTVTASSFTGNGTLTLSKSNMGDAILANHTGASGNLLTLQSDSSNKFTISKTGKITIASTAIAGRESISAGAACQTVSSTDVSANSVILVTPITTDIAAGATLKVKSISAGVSFLVCTADESNVGASNAFSYLVIN